MKSLLNKYKEYRNKKNKDISTIIPVNKVSYSQCAEDLLIEYIFNLRNIPLPSYIDIGANHPFFLSNTAIFHQKGCRGINIEANPALINNFKKYRPNDTNLNIGIGFEESEMDLFVFNDSTLSTFSKDECSKFEAIGNCNVEKIIKVKISTIQKILEKYNNGIFPDFLSLDVEGMDFEILKSINYESNTPKVICVEAAEYSPIGAGARRTELIDFLVEKGYYEYANTNLNAIMVRKDFWFI